MLCNLILVFIGCFHSQSINLSGKVLAKEDQPAGIKLLCLTEMTSFFQEAKNVSMSDTVSVTVIYLDLLPTLVANILQTLHKVALNVSRLSTI